jgi:hypothetical protein
MSHIQYAILILLVIGSFSCYFGPHETIYGSGHVVTEERNIDDFTGLKVSSGIDVVIRQGKVISLELEADDNLHDVILTEVEGDVLKVYTEKNIRKARSKKVFLVYEELNSIRISSAGDVVGENILKTEVSSKDVAELVCALVGPAFAKTTGAQIPIDGGNERVI